MRCIVFPGVVKFHWCQMKTDWFSWENMLNVHFSLPLVFFLHMKYVFSALNGLQIDETRDFRTQSLRDTIWPGFRFYHLPWWKQFPGWTENPADLQSLGTGYRHPWINPLKPSTEHSSVKIRFPSQQEGIGFNCQVLYDCLHPWLRIKLHPKTTGFE